jgi:hypothetical protein
MNCRSATAYILNELSSSQEHWDEATNAERTWRLGMHERYIDRVASSRVV